MKLIDKDKLLDILNTEIETLSECCDLEAHPLIKGQVLGMLSARAYVEGVKEWNT